MPPLCALNVHIWPSKIHQEPSSAYFIFSFWCLDDSAAKVLINCLIECLISYFLILDIGFGCIEIICLHNAQSIIWNFQLPWMIAGSTIMCIDDVDLCFEGAKVFHATWYIVWYNPLPGPWYLALSCSALDKYSKSSYEVSLQPALSWCLFIHS